MNTIRKGKIAKLPRGIREQLNRHLDEGMEAEPLLAWVNELPETKRVLAEHFEGNAITPQNLSEWRQGGYQDWLRAEQARELAEQMLEEGQDLESIAKGPVVNERLGLILSLELAGRVRQWQRETGEPQERWRQLRQFLGELAVLRREDHRAQRAKIANEKWGWETEALEEAKQIKLKETRQKEAKALFKKVYNALYGFGDSAEGRRGESEARRALDSGKPLPEWLQKLLAEREAGEEGPETRRVRASAARWRAAEEEREKKRTQIRPRSILDDLDARSGKRGVQGLAPTGFRSEATARQEVQSQGGRKAETPTWANRPGQSDSIQPNQTIETAAAQQMGMKAAEAGMTNDESLMTKECPSSKSEKVEDATSEGFCGASAQGKSAALCRDAATGLGQFDQIQPNPTIEMMREPPSLGCSRLRSEASARQDGATGA